MLKTAPDEPIVQIQRVEHDSRVHIDIETDDIASEVARLEKLSAAEVDRLERWVVMQAPSGQRFCVVRIQRPVSQGMRIVGTNPQVEHVEFSMSNLATVELKAFLPSKDFEVSKQFYQDLGFTVAWSNDGLAYIHHGKAAFLLQKYYVKAFAENLMMHLLVEDVESWWARNQDVLLRHGIKSEPPKDQPWGIRDFVFLDPTGVLWRVGQNIN